VVLNANASEDGAQMETKGRKINIINYKKSNILASAVVLMLLIGTGRSINNCYL